MARLDIRRSRGDRGMWCHLRDAEWLVRWATSPWRGWAWQRHDLYLKNGMESLRVAISDRWIGTGERGAAAMAAGRGIISTIIEYIDFLFLTTVQDLCSGAAKCITVYTRI